MRNYLAHFLIDWEDRIKMALLFFIIGVTLIPLIPYSYYRFFDNTEYIVVPEPISFDRKIYHACDPAVSIIKYKVTYDVETHTQTILYRIDELNNVRQQIGSTRQGTRLLHPRDGIEQPLVIPFQIPCELTPGSYFYDITYHYKIRGFDRQSNVQSDIFTIVPPEEPIN